MVPVPLHGSKSMKKKKLKWPTLKGRLKNALTNEIDALLQLKNSIGLTDAGEKRLTKLLKKAKK